MDRIIEVKVGGNYIRKDKKTAGVRGEYEVAILRIEFDESWDEYEKSITFLDATGLNPVYKELDETRLENYTPNGRVYLIRIPKEPMAVAGDMTFVIDGIAGGKKQRSMSDKLEVKYAPMPDDAKEPAEPTPNDVEQMRLELGRIKGSISDVLNMTVTSDTLEPWQEASVVKTLYENAPPSLWFGIPKGNTGDSGVYIGDEAPSDPDVNVWISPDAMASILRIKDENGTWHDITAVRGLSAYEIALQNGFEGSEEEWINKVEAEARMAEEARDAADVFAGQALQSANYASESADKAEKANLTAGNNAVLAREYKREAQEYALAAGESATSAHDFAVQAEEQKGFAQEYANASGENVTVAHDFAEQAKSSADKAEQYANEMSGVLPNIEAGLSLRPTTEQVKAMHEENMAGTYNIRKIPEGKTIDDLYLEEDYGLYMIDDECPFAEREFTSRGSQLIVTGGYYWLEGFGDKSTTCQVLLCHDGHKYVIKQRSLQNGKWSDWEDQFATKYDVSQLTYLKDFLKDRPQGLYVDDLDNLTYENTGGGVFLWGEPQNGAKQNDIVFVTQGLSPMCDDLTTFQMRISLATAYPEPNRYNIKQRYRKHNSQGDFDGWSEWEDIYTTFKKVPYGKSIDDLYDEEHLGWYIGKVKSNFNNEYNPDEDFHFLFVNDGWTITDKGDIADYFQTRFIWDGFNYKIQTRKGSAGGWSDWEDCFGTGGGGATFFDSATPQIDITLEEDTTSLDITTIGDKPLSDYNYTTVKILIENAVLSEKGANGGLNVYINSDYGSRYRVTLPGFPTTFLTNNTKQYWSGYCNIVEGILFGLASATGNAAWGANMQTLADSSSLHEYKKVERIYLLTATTTVPMPIGTKIKIWFK